MGKEEELTAAIRQCGGGGVRNHGVLRVVRRRLVGVLESVRRRRDPCSVCAREEEEEEGKRGMVRRGRQVPRSPYLFAAEEIVGADFLRTVPVTDGD